MVWQVVPVESGGEVVAHLCTACDAQLPSDFVSAEASFYRMIEPTEKRFDTYNEMRTWAADNGHERFTFRQQWYLVADRA